MKRIIRQILGWGMMLSLPLVMTSCGVFKSKRRWYRQRFM